jgi:hypothetical protein
MVQERTFRATVTGAGGKAQVALPFDPDEVWGRRARHDLTGDIGGHAFRGKVQITGSGPILSLGPAWRRDAGVGIGDEVLVALRPEGPQVGAMEPDLVAAFAADPEARAIFERMSTSCRKSYMRWVDEAKRPETRARRIGELMQFLHKDRRNAA